MTANELADLIINADVFEVEEYFSEIATMLRQQDKEIKELKVFIDLYQNMLGGYEAEIKQLKALVISLSPNANLIYTRSEK
jgi:hypothetical protein